MVFFDVPISTNLFQADNKLLLVLRLDSMAYLTLPSRKVFLPPGSEANVKHSSQKLHTGTQFYGNL